MTWRKSKNHTTASYFCLVITKGVGQKNRHKIIYPSIPSTIRPTLHFDELPVPAFIELSPSEEESIDEKILKDSDSPSYATSESTPQKFSQQELSDLLHELGLTKNAEEILASKLQEKALLNKITKVSYF